MQIRQVGPTNQIVNDSDSKPSKFERQNLSDSKSDNEFRLQLKDDDEIQLIATISRLNLL